MKKRDTEEHIIGFLRKADAGLEVDAFVRLIDRLSLSASARNAPEVLKADRAAVACRRRRSALLTDRRHAADHPNVPGPA